MPKSVKIDISDIIGNVKLLPVSGGRLDESKETIQKLNSVSETIGEMAQSYGEVAWAISEEDTDIKFKEKRIFHEELLNNIEDMEDNILYEDIADDNELIIDDIYDILEQNEFITKEELIQVLENNNNYIIGVGLGTLGDPGCRGRQPLR